MMTIHEAAYASLVNDDAKAIEKLLFKHRTALLGDGNDAFLMSHAAGQGRLAHVQILAKFGTDVNASQDKDPEGAIVSAAREGHQEVVRWFLDHGATINHVVDGKSRCFALTGAVRNGHLNVVKLLVERGADVNAVGPGLLPLGYAIAYNRTEIAAFLRSLGAKAADEQGKSG